ncbi:MACPF domain-containing protein At1g14780-like [Magnolia sinica]|uniref:MACPF domain-containing protein At1g14780-like n=1 Tax=Magnolia sinica TaxID=86752 RepID=UPI00265A4348|nr:MACPF domain-containing protein At1g14780-like [Magnolia sinica]
MINVQVPHAFNVFDHQPVLIDSFASLPVTKDGITVIWSKRGGDAMAQSHCEWLLTVPSMPDAINFTFIPITSLLKGVPGRGFLSHAINLYLRCKPTSHLLPWKIWPHNNVRLPHDPRGLHMKTPIQIVQITGRRINGGWPKNHINWMPVQWKKFSHVCTAPVKYNPGWAHDPDTAFVVSGAQLQVLKYESKNVLHLRLLFSKVSSCGVYRSVWQQGSSDTSQKFSLLSAISTSITGFSDKEKQPPIVIVDSGVFPTGPPVPLQAQKHLKFVDTSHVCKGAQESPGHWLVSGAKLDLVKGKICVHVKFSLLNFNFTCK